MSSFLGRARQFVKRNQNDLILVGGIILVSLISFGVGRLTAPQPVAPEPIVIENAIPAAELSQNEIPKEEEESGGGVASQVGKYVASISGTKYHLPDCSGAKRIKEENKVWFNSKEEAEKAGYEPAGNCPGLK